MRQRNGRGNMHKPPPCVVRNSGTHLDQTLDEPFHGALHFFAPDIELTDYMREVLGQNAHLQPGLVSLEALTTGLVPAQGVFGCHTPDPVGIHVDDQPLFVLPFQEGVGGSSKVILAPSKSIIIARLKSSRIASFWLSPLSSTSEPPGLLIYHPYIK